MENNYDESAMKRATFAAGCFWHVQHYFDNIDGVVDSKVGYTGGKTENPTYKQVCSGKTGHAEAVEVIFDPKIISYEQLLVHFWSMHDPTTLNRQGPDVGSQYRSEIFAHSVEQESLARASKQRLGTSGKFNRPIVTKISSAGDFWPAEEYHQKYFEKTGIRGCGI